MPHQGIQTEQANIGNSTINEFRNALHELSREYNTAISIKCKLLIITKVRVQKNDVK